VREQREPARVLLRAVRRGMQPPPALADEEEPVPAGGEWRRHVSWCARAGEVAPARGVCAAQAAAVSSRACVRLGRVAGPDTHGGREARRATGRSRRQRKVAHS